VSAAVALRPATAADEPFFARVYAATREEELAHLPFSAEQKAAFVAQQFAAQSAHYARHYGDAAFDVVLVDGAPAGRLIVHRGGGGIVIVDIALLPEFRGRGIGGRLLATVLAEADAAGATVTIHVERHNRALRLYERLGFAVVADDQVYLTLERPPSLKPGSRAADS
jgi:ribosomal protein S18 acetylase RimI-like enzyme